MALERPVDGGANHREDSGADGNHQRPLPTWLSVRAVGVEDVVGPGGRVVCGDRSETRDEEIDAEGEAELFALEPLRQNGGDGNDHRLGAEAEDGPARDHHAGLAAQGGEESSRET